MPIAIAVPRRTIIAAGIATLLLVLLTITFVYLPKAEIALEPKIVTRSIEQSIVISASQSEPDFVRFILPVKVVETEVTHRQTITRSEAGQHEDFATGVVTLVNEQDEEQPLLPKTHLRHEDSGVFFLTDEAVRIPPRGTIPVRVTAKEKGSEGNVAPGRFVVDKLPQPLQSIVYAESSVPFSSGIATETAVTEEELRVAHEQVLTEARHKAQGELTLMAGGAPIPEE
ncbi:MAG: hypothetical protein ACRD4B_04985, partial [Acidobacteriota bacterium]